MSETYYDMLGVGTDASEDEIEQAYRRLVRTTHPDVSDDPDAREQMVELTKARDTLTDTQKRAAYDAEQNINGKRTQQPSQSADEHTQTQSRTSSTHRQHDRRRGSRAREEATGTAGTRNSTGSRTRSGRNQRRTHTRTRTQTSQTTTASETGSIGSVPLRLRIRYLFTQSGPLLIDGILRMISTIFDVSTLYLMSGSYRKRIRSVFISATTLRLVITFGLWWGVVHILPLLGINTISRGGKFLVLGSCLFATYLGHDLIGEYLGLFDDWSSDRFQIEEEIRFWPIIVTNLLALGLFFWAFSIGSPSGGLVFAFGTTFIFMISMVVFGLLALLVAIGIGPVFGGALFVVFPAVVSLLAPFIILFTSYGSHGWVRSVLGDIPVSVSYHPWVSSQLVGQIGPVYGGLVVNVMLGGIMLGGFSWSLLMVCRVLTKTPWTDRFERGYHIRPGLWNFVVVAPFIVFLWGMVQYAYAVHIPIVGGVILLPLGELLIIFGILPATLTSLYLLRRRAEPWLQDTVWGR